MNLFYTDPDPGVCAQNLDNKRVIKMILETTQMLCTAVSFNSFGAIKPLYKSTHYNHPSSVWIRTNRENYKWAVEHLFALHSLYPNEHASLAALPEIEDFALSGDFPNTSTNMTPVPNCAANKSKGLNFKHITPTCQAYKLYLTERWKTDTLPPVWTYGVEPSWRGNYVDINL